MFDRSQKTAFSLERSEESFKNDRYTAYSSRLEDPSLSLRMTNKKNLYALEQLRLQIANIGKAMMRFASPLTYLLIVTKLLKLHGAQTALPFKVMALTEVVE